MPPRRRASPRARRPRRATGAVARDVEVLAQVPYFAALPPAELRELARRCASRTFAVEAALFEEGDPCHGLFVVAEGAVEVRQISPRGRAQVFHTEGPAATLGEAPLFDRGGYIATAVATAPTRALFLPRAHVLALCRRHPSVALAMLEALSRRVRAFAEIVGDLAFRPVAERVARYLASAGARRRSGEVDLPLTQAQVAARLGTVRELVARALAELARTGVIARRRSTIVIRDPERLAALARGDRAEGV